MRNHTVANSSAVLLTNHVSDSHFHATLCVLKTLMIIKHVLMYIKLAAS